MRLVVDREAAQRGSVSLVVIGGLALVLGSSLLMAQTALMRRVESGWRVLGAQDDAPLTCDEPLPLLLVHGPTRQRLFGPAADEIACLPMREDHGAPGASMELPRAFCTLLAELDPTIAVQLGDFACN